MLNTGEMHSMKCVYYPTAMFIHSVILDWILTILLQAIPAYCLDFFNTDKRIQLTAISRKLQSMRKVIAFFLSKRFQFETKNIQSKVYDK